MAFDRRETAILLIGDFLLLIASLWIALFLRNLTIPDLSYFESNLVPFLPMFLLSLAVFYIAGLYEKQTRPIRRVMGTRVLGAQLGNAVIAALLFFTLPLTITPKTILAIFVAVSVVLVSIWRFYRMHHEMATAKRTPALLIGKGSSIRELFEEVNGNSRYLIHFTEHLDTESLSETALSNAVEEGIKNGAQAIVVDVYDAVVSRMLPTLYELVSRGVLFRDFAGLYEEIFDRVPLNHIGIDRILEVTPNERLLYDLSKRAFDLVLAAIGSVVALPFILFGIVGRVLTGTPVFFLHERIGRGGKRFTMIKLGSMRLNDHGDPELQKKNGVTRFGKFLRKTRIDELPQLWNVLAGELSFIGPRPELPTIAETYEREIPFYRMRYLITPGLSGWAQIHDYDAPKGPADVERTRRKLSFDLYYLKHRSFGLDLAIAVKTVRALVALSGT